MATVFIVEDDSDIREMESYALLNSGFGVRAFGLGKELFNAMTQEKPDLILLDIMLPQEDGLSILTRLRSDAATATIPVIMVTAKTTETDKVRGLDMGADDYLTKPFGILELVSRIRALLRRAHGEQGRLLCYGDMCIDEDKHCLTVGGKVVELTYKEFQLLTYLMQHQGKVISRDKLMDAVWGFAFAGESRTVDMHIKTLRKKLGEHATCVKTVRNVGYKLGD